MTIVVESLRFHLLSLARARPQTIDLLLSASQHSSRPFSALFYIHQLMSTVERSLAIAMCHHHGDAENA